ncbi:MAG: hypothetical protein JWM65_1502 [Sphingomonas bacterium]|nr:hypothetical protein [Sphingomonas bacterium]
MIVLSLLLAAAGPVAATAPHPVRHVVHHRAVRHVVRRKHRIDTRLRLAGCGYNATGRCAAARSPYRLPLAEPLPPTAKADALAQTGNRCALIGQTICTSPPREILHIEK